MKPISSLPANRRILAVPETTTVAPPRCCTRSSRQLADGRVNRCVSLPSLLGIDADFDALHNSTRETCSPNPSRHVARALHFRNLPLETPESRATEKGNTMIRKTRVFEKSRFATMRDWFYFCVEYDLEICNGCQQRARKKKEDDETDWRCDECPHSVHHDLWHAIRSGRDTDTTCDECGRVIPLKDARVSADCLTLTCATHQEDHDDVTGDDDEGHAVFALLDCG